MKTFSIIVSMVMMLSACGTSKKVTQDDIDYLKSIVDSKSFEIELEWAEPQVTNAMMQVANAGLLPVGSNVSSINLIGNSNFFKMEGDTISALLPYFGERQMGGTYGGSDGGIQFEGIPEDLVIAEVDENSYKINFRINDKINTSEMYMIELSMFPSLQSFLFINSTQKTSIRYRGRVLKTKAED